MTQMEGSEMSEVSLAVEDLFLIERAVAAALCDGLHGKTITDLECAHDKLNQAIDRRRVGDK